MSLDDLWKDELDEIAEESKDEKGQIKRVVFQPKAPDEEIDVIPKVRTIKIKTFKIPDFNDFLQFCDKYRENDYEVEQFYKHTIPRRLHKSKYEQDRGGGGWSGAVKATINILRKMKEKGVI